MTSSLVSLEQLSPKPDGKLIALALSAKNWFQPVNF
jgi:hypothetical protein